MRSRMRRPLFYCVAMYVQISREADTHTHTVVLSNSKMERGPREKKVHKNNAWQVRLARQISPYFLFQSSLLKDDWLGAPVPVISVHSKTFFIFLFADLSTKMDGQGFS